MGGSVGFPALSASVGFPALSASWLHCDVRIVVWHFSGVLAPSGDWAGTQKLGGGGKDPVCGNALPVSIMLVQGSQDGTDP